MFVLYSQNYAARALRILFNTPKKSLLKSSYPKKYLPNFRTQKNPGIKNFKPQKILRSSPSLEIPSTPPPRAAKWAQTNGEVERLQIAQAENKPWRAELRKYHTAYRSIPQNTTGRSPAELLFNRKVKGKIPDLSIDHAYDHEVHDRDAEQKAKSKAYTAGPVPQALNWVIKFLSNKTLRETQHCIQPKPH